MSSKSSVFTAFIARARETVYALQVFNILRFLAYFIVSVLLVRASLSISRIASYEYVLFLSSIVTGWWIHGFIQGFMSEMGKDSIEERRAAFRQYSRLFFMMGGAICVVVLLILQGLVAIDFLDPIPEGFYFFLMYHFILQIGIVQVYYFYRQGWFRLIYVYGMYLFLAYVGAFLFLMIEDVTLSVVYMWLFVLVLPMIIGWAWFYFQDHPSEFQRAGQFSYSGLSKLVLIQGIGFLSLWTDSYWVQYFFGTDEIFALFRYGGREFPLVVILTTTFSTAMINWKSEKDGLNRIRQGSIRFIRGFTGLALFLLLTSQWLFTWVYNSTFTPASFVFDAYILLMLVRVVFPRPLLIEARKYNALVGISIIELLINVILSYFLYWVFGLLGMILASLIAHFFELSASIYVVKSRLHIRPSQYIPIRLYLLFASGVVLVFLIKYLWFPQPWLPLLIGPG